MTDPTFVTNRLAELPTELNGPQGQAWARGMGAVQDQLMARLRVAGLSDLPFFCPDDALDANGAWLLLPRFTGEPNGTAPTGPGFTNGTGYRGRLCGAWRSWIIAGSKGSIIESLNAYGLPDVAIQNDYEAVPPWAGAWWSRFRVLIGPTFGSYGWGPGNDPTPNEQNQIRQQILLWKWAYAYPVDVTVDDGMGYTFVFWVGPLIDYGLVIDEAPIGGYL